ncbi:MAG: DUF599 domain-containing protein [Pseudomonadota bacterium]
MSDLLSAFSVLDFCAVAFVVVSWLGVGLRIEHPGSRKPSVTVMMAAYRREWMQMFAERDVRIFDAQILASLRQGTAFFASSSILAIGGLLALMGRPDQISGIAMAFSQTSPPAVIFQTKLALAVAFVVMAFLKFVWANRLFGYCAVIMAAVPNDPNAPNSNGRAGLAAEINIRAAMNFNRGLRSMYFALASLVWLVGPIGLIVATSAAVWTLWSREFSSLSQKLLEDHNT